MSENFDGIRIVTLLIDGIYFPWIDLMVVFSKEKNIKEVLSIERWPDFKCTLSASVIQEIASSACRDILVAYKFIERKHKKSRKFVMFQHTVCF